MIDAIPGLTKRVLVVDAETASPVDLKKEGQYRYFEHPDTRVLMLGYKWLGGTRSTVIDFEKQQGPLPQELVEAIEAPPAECMLAAANANFDKSALCRLGYPTDDSKWLDVLTCAYALGFSGRLNNVLRQVFDAPSLIKDPQGTRCITFFSVKQNKWFQDPALWEQFVQYCRMDAHVEEVLLAWCLQRLTQSWFLPSFLKIHQQDLIYRRINRRGLPVDQAAVDGAIRIRDTAVDQIKDVLKAVTGLDNPNSRDQMLKWSQDNGSRLDNLRKADVRDEVARLEAELAEHVTA